MVLLMNALFEAMSWGMDIDRYYNEPEDSFIYRLCYSALGLWCLHISQNSIDGVVGTTKNNQTMVLNKLIQCYSELFPIISDKFIEINKQRNSFAVHIRRVYEETGYFITDENNRNCLANYGRSIPIGNTALFFGIPSPSKVFNVNGLGIFTKSAEYVINIKDFLIRDTLTWEDYFQSQFDYTDFYDRDINYDELEFFSPLSNNVPSQSWEKQMKTDCSMARKSEMGPYYRVMRTAETSLLFADEPVSPQDDSFFSYEYRRLLYALKAHYKKPLIANIVKLDESYSRIGIRGQLPNREYYYLLLLSWPVNSVFDKANFLVRNDFISEVNTILANIGIEMRDGK